MMATETAPIRLLYPVPEARQLLGGIGVTCFYAIVKDGGIKITKVRGRSFVAASELRRFSGEDPAAKAA
jgi:hypothetical protein